MPLPIDGFDDVLAAARTGQEWAVECLYNAIHPPIMGYLAWQEPSMAEDLAAETWMAVAERIKGFNGDEGSFRAWIFSIARRRLADHRRRVVRRQTSPVPERLLASVSTPNRDDPAVVAVEKMSSEQALACLTASLPSDQAEVVVLRVIAGLSVEETAQVVSKRPGTVRVLQHRALRHLARQLRKPAIEV